MFCKHHGVRELSLSMMESEGYTLSQVFNVDETGLGRDCTKSSKSLLHCRVKQAKNFKKSKDRVTLLVCVNASGTCKLALVFISKSGKPCCFKHMDMSSLYAHYTAPKKS